MAALGIYLRLSYDYFLPVLVVFLVNIKWHPRDRLKRIALFWFVPVLTYTLSIGFSSLNIGAKITGVRRVFTAKDLQASEPKRNITDVEDALALCVAPLP